MDEILDKDVYTLDLSNIVYIPEIIYKLSSVLEKDEVKNRRICLKLGNISLNQAQLLSIKSLINGADSSLSCIDTKSSDTEKMALSLGIMVANVLKENVSEIEPEHTYRKAEELETETIAKTEQKQENFSEINSIEEKPVTIDNTQRTLIEGKKEIEDQSIISEKTENDSETKLDELEVIFGTTSLDENVFNAKKIKDEYAPREEIGDIVVSETGYTKEDIEIESFPTKYVKQTLRSGQVINYDGNVIIIGDCHVGCEIVASGDITVWGILSGIAHAGANGNRKAAVRALKMNAIQVRIADCYSRRPDTLNTIFTEKTNSFTPEEARIVNGEIIVFKINS